MMQGVKTKTFIIFSILTIIMAGVFGFGGACLALYIFNGTEGGIVENGRNTEENVAEVETADKLHENVQMIDGEYLSIPEIYRLCSDSIVEITTETVQSAGPLRQFIASGAGSGVIITGDGYIVTCNHVVEGARLITVHLKNGENYNATMVGQDKKTDLAILKIEAGDLAKAIPGDSDSLIVGEPAFAIGNPLGELGGTMSEGIISALDREIIIEGENMELLQTTAAVNPGNSGGGLFNGRGELIGIVNAKSSGTGIEGLGFAIPANIAIEVAEQIIAYGYVQGRPDLGVELIDFTDPRLALFYGVLNTGVYVLEVKEENGLLPRDRIVSIDGVEVESTAEVKEIVDKHQAGDELALRVQRGNNILDLTVTLGQATS